ASGTEGGASASGRLVILTMGRGGPEVNGPEVESCARNGHSAPPKSRAQAASASRNPTSVVLVESKCLLARYDAKNSGRAALVDQCNPKLPVFPGMPAPANLQVVCYNLGARERRSTGQALPGFRSGAGSRLPLFCAARGGK